MKESIFLISYEYLPLKGYIDIFSLNRFTIKNLDSPPMCP